MIETILIALTALYIYEREALEIVEKSLIDVKPFNCILCLSFITGAIAFIITQQPIYLSIPLLYRVTQVKLLR